MEKVIRGTYQVIVKTPLGACQGSLVRKAEIVSTASPQGAITKLATMLQRRSRLSRVEPVQQFPIVRVCTAMRFPRFPTNKPEFRSRGGKGSLKHQVGSQLEDDVYRPGRGRVRKALQMMRSGQSLLKHSTVRVFKRLSSTGRERSENESRERWRGRAVEGLISEFNYWY